jgi:hypothetical protein
VRLGALSVIGLGALAACSEPPAPPPQDALDGVYENAECPGFTITDGKLQFAGGTIAARVERGKSGYYLASEQSLRYQIEPGGCRLLVNDAGANYLAERKEFASPVVMIALLSQDRTKRMYWTRTGQ